MPHVWNFDDSVTLPHSTQVHKRLPVILAVYTHGGAVFRRSEVRFLYPIAEIYGLGECDAIMLERLGSIPWYRLKRRKTRSSFALLNTVAPGGVVIQSASEVRYGLVHVAALVVLLSPP